MKNNLTLVFNRSELGAGTRGSSLGIDSILIEASKRMKTFFINTPRINIEDKYLQRIVRKNYYYRNTKGYHPSLNNTRNLFCFDTESLLNKKLTKIDDIVDFILLIGRKLGLFFEEFVFKMR